jgi:hypothetical protein
VKFLDNITKDEQKAIELAEEFNYLPLGIAAAKLYIQACNISITRYLERLRIEAARQQVEEQEAELLKLSYVTGSQRAAIRLAIRKLDRDASNILAMCSFLATNNIPFFLLEEQVRNLYNSLTNLEIEMTLEVINNGLKRYSMINVTGDDEQRKVSIHGITQDVMRSQLSKEEQERCINDILEILAKHFTRDNRSPEALQKNAQLLSHVETVLEHIHHYELNVDITLMSSLQLTKAVYYSFVGQSLKAREVLKKLVLDIEHQAESQRQIGAQAICETLAKIDPKLPTIYAQALYHLGRTNFYIERSVLPEYGSYLEQAVEIRRIIDADPSTYNDSYNAGKPRPMDSVLVRRSGVLQFLSMHDTKESLLQAEQGYLTLIEEENMLPAEKQDEFNQKTCYRELSTIYKRMGQLAEDPILRASYYDKAVVVVCNSLEINVDPAAVNYQDIFNQLQTRTTDIRIAKDYNNIANILLEKNTPEDILWAERFFTKAKEIEEAKGVSGDNFPLADALYGLAKIYQGRNDTQAKECIARCLQIREQMHSVFGTAEAQSLQAHIMQRIASTKDISQQPTLWNQQQTSLQAEAELSPGELPGPPIK